ncbi:MAG: hypothetical protein IJ572_01185 [Bacilli bacterium]|nr:hypothetical protein [Bacilli bacterium]
MSIKKEKINQIIFYLGYFLLIITIMLSRVPLLNSLLFYVKILAYLLLSYNIILSFGKMKFKSILLIIALLLIAGLSAYFSKDTLPIRLIFIILSSRNVNFNDFIKKDFYLKIVMIILVVLLHYIGLTNDYVMYRSDGTIRNSMGFNHPNVFGFHLMIICFEYFYLEYKKNNRIKWYNYLFLLVIGIIVDYFSDSRSSILAMAIFALLIIFMNSFKTFKSKKITRKTCTNLFIILAIFTLIFTFLYRQNNDIAIFIDKLTSKRLYYNNLFYTNYGFSMFGQEVITISTEKARQLNKVALVLDNSYIHLLVRYGIALFITYALLFKKALKNTIDNNKILFLIMITLLIFGLSESNILFIEMCPFLLYFKTIIFKERGK